MRRTLLLLAILCLTLARPVRAQAAEDSVRAVIASVFDAMRAQDSITVRNAFLPEGRLIATSTREGRPNYRVQTVEAFSRAIASGERLDERVASPSVTIDGNLASARAYYDFYIGTRFSHCGIDAFHVVRTPDGWKIAEIAYTVDSSCNRQGS